MGRESGCIEFVVYGEPVAKGRPRVSRHGTYTPKKTVEYEKKVAESWQLQSGQIIENGFSIGLEIEAVFQIPKSYSRKKTQMLYGKPHLKRPDTDNLIKSLSDGLNGKAYGDDSAIYSIKAVKRYARDGEEPHVRVLLYVGEKGEV